MGAGVQRSPPQTFALALQQGQHVVAWVHVVLLFSLCWEAHLGRGPPVLLADVSYITPLQGTGKHVVDHHSNLWGKTVSHIPIMGCSGGRNALCSSAPGYYQPQYNHLLAGWLKYWFPIALFFCNSNSFRACLKICLSRAQINLNLMS